jgi:hypothetical protein
VRATTKGICHSNGYGAERAGVVRLAARVKQIVNGWEIVSCRAKQPWHAIYMFLQMLVGNPDIAPAFSTATWTVREMATGAVRKVTARSEQEAADKAASGMSDNVGSG